MSPPTLSSDFPKPWPHWLRYGSTVATSGLAWMLALWISGLDQTPSTPFLSAFAAVVFAAVFSGFGPSILATGLASSWTLWMLVSTGGYTPSGIAIRLALFVGQGVLLSFCSGHLRRTADQLAATASWHRRLVDTSAEGIWVVNNDDVVTYANPRIAEILGTTVEDVVAKRRDAFFFAADLPVERIRFQNRRAGHIDQFDRRLRRLDGTEVWVLTCSSPVLDEAGNLLSVLSMMTDITERKRAEYALRRSEEKFRSLFENVLEGVYQSTPDGRILAANPMLLRMLDLTNETQLNDINIADDLYVDKSVRVRLLERLENDGSFQNIEYQLRRRDGGIITVQENARVVRDEEGTVLYYEGTLTDVTDQRRVQDQLREAQKMEALGRLAGGIAQDFSNVLTIISGYGRLLLDDLPPGHLARPSAEHVVTAAASAHSLTEQLLSFSRRRAVAIPEVDFNEATRTAADAIKSMFEPDFHIAINLSPARAAVSVERNELEQILKTLAGRFQTMLPATGTLEIRTEIVPQDSGRVRHHAATHPAGYAVLSMSSRDAAAAGTAEIGPLGLSSLLAPLGGFVSVEQMEGSGPVISVFLPLAGPELPPHFSRALANTAVNPRSRILLVNAEPLIRELSRDILERQGYEVVLAQNAAEAEGLAVSDRFDLLITDLTADPADAMFVSALQVSQPALKVLYISGYERDRNGLPQDLDPSAVLQKPFSADSLGRKIREILSRTL